MGETYNRVASTSAAERNKESIREVLARYLSSSVQGTVLECASGAGTHVCHLARAFPELIWQPSELHEAPALKAATACLENVRTPVLLDLRLRTLPEGLQAGSLVGMLAVNVTHISAWEATLGLLEIAGQGLAPGTGFLFLYGPFLLNGKPTTESNAAFDAELRARDAGWGYRDVDHVLRAAAEQGLQREVVVAMPADNFMVVLRKS